MVNGSFVFGMDDDDADVFDRTVEWAVEQGIETATFHILTPYPARRSTSAWRRRAASLHRDWDLYDTRHVVYRPARHDAASSWRTGYWRAYRDFYRWGDDLAGRGDQGRCSATGCGTWRTPAGWKKFEPLWDVLIRIRPGAARAAAAGGGAGGFGTAAVPP